MATNPAMVVRIAANLAELKAALKEGKDEIVTTTAAMNKLAAGLSGDKLIQNANNIVAAVNEIGGAATLTDREKARLNGTLGRAIEKYQALGKEAPTAMKELFEQTKRVEQKTGDADKVAGGWARTLDSVVAGAVAGLTVKVIDLAQQLLTTAVQGFGEFIRRGGEVASMSRGFVSLAGGVAEADSRLGAMRTSTVGLVGDFALMQASNKATLLELGLSDAQMAQTAKTAIVLGRAMGLDAARAVDTLIIALGRQSTLRLDDLGLTVRAGEAYQTYADKLRTTADQLTDAEKKQAFMNAAMAAAAEKVADLGGLQLTAADRWLQIKTGVGNTSDALATWLVQQGLVNLALDNAAGSAAVWEAFLRQGVTPALETYQRLSGETVPVVDSLGNAWARAAREAQALALSEDELNRISAELTTSAEKQISISNALFGFDVINRANDMVEALGGVENITKLTTGKKEELRQAVTRALDTYKTLGETAPAELVKVKNATFDVAEMSQFLRDNVGKLVDGFTLLEGIGATITRELRDPWIESRIAIEQYQLQLAATRQAQANSLFEAQFGNMQKQADTVLGKMTAILDKRDQELASLNKTVKGYDAAYGAIVDQANLALQAVQTGWEEASKKASSHESLVRTATASYNKLNDAANRSPFLASRNEIIRLSQEGRFFGPVTEAGFPDFSRLGPLRDDIPGRAGGGPVDAGRPFRVGERGPEVFVPSASGTIIPNQALGGASISIAPGAVVINYPIMNDPRARFELTELISDALIAKIRSGVQLPSGA